MKTKTKTFLQKHIGILALMALCMLFNNKAQATTYTWTGGAGTTAWTTPGNWDVGTNFPGFGAGDVAIITTTSSFHPQFVTESIASLTINNGATLIAAGAGNLTVTGGIDIEGTLDLSINTGVIIVTGAITGGGALFLKSGKTIQVGGGLSVAVISAPGSATVKLTGSQTIGSYTLANLTLSNSAVVNCGNLTINLTLNLGSGTELIAGPADIIAAGVTGNILSSGTIDVTSTGNTDDLISQYPIINNGGTVNLTNTIIKFAGAGNQTLSAEPFNVNSVPTSIPPLSWVVATTSGGVITFNCNISQPIVVNNGGEMSVGVGDVISGDLTGSTGTIDVTQTGGDDFATQYQGATIPAPVTIKYTGTGAQTLTTGFNPANFIIANSSGVTFNTNEAPTTGTTINSGALLIVASGNALGGSLGGSGTAEVTNTGTSPSNDNLTNQYTGSLTLTSLTIEYAGTLVQVIATGETFDNLNIANTSGVTTTANISVSGTLTVGSGADFNPGTVNTITGNSGTTVFGGTGTTHVNNVAAGDVLENQYITFHSYTLTGLTTVYDGATTAQELDAHTFGGLTINNAHNVSLNGNVTIGGNFTLSLGTFSANTFTVYVGGNMSKTSGTFADGTGTVQFQTAGSFTVAPIIFNNLNIGDGSAATNITCTGTLLVNGTLNVNDGSALYGDGSQGMTMSHDVICGTLASAGLYNYPVGYSGTHSNGGSEITINGNLSGTGELFLYGASALTDGAELCNIAGNMTIADFQNNAGLGASTVRFTGSSAQIVEPGGVVGGNYIFDFLDIDNAVTLNNTSGYIKILADLNGNSAMTTNTANVRLYGNLNLPDNDFVTSTGQETDFNGYLENITGTHIQTVAHKQAFYSLQNHNSNTIVGGSPGGVTIGTNLDFVAGNFELGTNNAIIAPGATLSWGTYPGTAPVVYTEGYFVTAGTGTLNMDPAPSSSIQYPVGISDASYTPITFQATTGDPVLDVRVKQHVTTSNGITQIPNVIDRTWIVSPEALVSQNFGFVVGWADIADETGAVDHTQTYVSYRLSETNSWIPNTAPGNTAQHVSPLSGNRDSTTGANWGQPSGLGSQLLMNNPNTYYIATGSDLTALPVSLLTFGAQYQGGHVNISWTTASEQNNAYFNVERSMDATNWTSIGQVQGHGTSNIFNSYLDIDNLQGIIPTGTIYYRLKQVDFNGAYEYSTIRSVDLTNQGPALSMYPNPTSNTLNVNWTSATGENAVLRMINMSGVSVYTQAVSGKGMIEKQIDMSILPSGIYYVQVIYSNGNVVSEAVNKN